jgi:creatinine amidohydrolase/Fe(II)-dependent formamide hydrolase-like protein
MVALALGLSAGAAAPAAQPRVALGELTTSELRERLARCPVALIYNGGIDETGPHVALAKHNLRAQRYGTEIARRLGNALLAPVIPYAPNPTPSPDLPGQIALRPGTYVAINEDVARSLIDGGFRRVAILAEHGMGLEDLNALATRLDGEFRGRGIRIFYVSDVYARAREEIEQEIKASGQVAGGHGGLWDTSETMAADPSAVRPDKFAFGTADHDGNGPPNEAGFSGDPRKSSVALGRRFGEKRIALAVDEIRRNLQAAGPCPR